MDIKGHLNAINNMKDSELKIVIGGGLSGTLINAIRQGLEFILELGRQVGSAISRKKRNSYCR